MGSDPLISNLLAGDWRFILQYGFITIAPPPDDLRMAWCTEWKIHRHQGFDVQVPYYRGAEPAVTYEEQREKDGF